MTDEEIRHEALQDFLEIKTKLQIALQDFAYTMRKQHSLHSVVQTKACRTRRRNTWNVHFYVKSRTSQKMTYGYLVYLPLQKGEHVYYLFLKGIDKFLLEIVTPHLVQRYKERYIEPNRIDLGRTPLAVYFLRHTMDMKKTDFIPSNWTEEEIRSKQVWISDQGLIVSEEKRDMRTFITFLDQENLTRYKALVYEEASLVRKYNKLREYSGKDEEVFWNLAKALFFTPNAAKIWERHLKRVSDHSQHGWEEDIRKNVEIWNRIEGIFRDKQKAKRTISDEMKESLIMPPEILEKMKKTIAEASELPENPENDF
jgi:hypothetical protein